MIRVKFIQVLENYHCICTVLYIKVSVCLCYEDCTDLDVP